MWCKQEKNNNIILTMQRILSSIKETNSTELSALQSLLQQFEEALATEEAPERAVDYEDSNTALEQSLASTSWDRDRDREEDAALVEDTNPSDGFDTQRNRLIDLLMSTRSKSLSGCFGGRLDRIGSSSTLGCNSTKRLAMMTDTDYNIYLWYINYFRLKLTYVREGKKSQ